jgi:5-formyltetrahydrofolate cyclo-ligase
MDEPPMTPSTAATIRAEVFATLDGIARPDSRYHLDFSEFIPDFTGSDAATDRLVAQDFYTSAQYAFVTPDPGLIDLRRRMLLAGKSLVVSTHGIRRGFYLLDPARIKPEHALFAAWLDGLEHFGTPISLREILMRGRFDLMVTGASAVSENGVRFGKGHGYFDMEWGMFTDLAVADEATPVVAVVHDTQVVARDLTPGPTDILVDYIATPTRFLTVQRGARPSGITWSMLSEERIGHMPPLQELRGMHGSYGGGIGPRG